MEKDKVEEKLYLGVYAILIALTLCTVLAAQISAAKTLTILIALTIASLKATLIALYYMHVRFEKPLIYGILLVGLLAVSILFLGLFPDIALKL